MHLHRHYHSNWKDYFKTPLSKLELSVWLHTFGRSLVSIFIPILLLTMGFSISNVILYYLIYNAIDVPLNFVARKFTIKHGAREVIFIGILFQIVGFLILYFGTFSFAILLALAFVLAGYDTFYWVAHWFVFNECVKSKKKAGRRVSGLRIVRKLASLISPLIGAGFLIFLNKEYLLIVSIAFLFLSLIPLFKLKLNYVVPKKKMNLKEFFSFRENRRDSFFCFLSHFHGSCEGVLLPLFVYVTFGSIEHVGMLPVIATIASIIFVYFVGRWSDKFNVNKLIFLGSFILALLWIVRVLYPTINIIYFTTLLIGLFSVLVGLPIDSNLVRNGKKTSMIDVSCCRNTSHMFGEFVFFLILFFIVDVFKISFLIASITMFLVTIVSGIVLMVGRKK